MAIALAAATVFTLVSGARVKGKNKPRVPNEHESIVEEEIPDVVEPSNEEVILPVKPSEPEKPDRPEIPERPERPEREDSIDEKDNPIRPNNETISFGDIVTIDEGAYIYTNCYDAAATTNG